MGTLPGFVIVVTEERGAFKGYNTPVICVDRPAGKERRSTGVAVDSKLRGWVSRDKRPRRGHGRETAVESGDAFHSEQEKGNKGTHQLTDRIL